MATKTPFRNVAGLNKALARVPKEASRELRKAAKDIAETVATKAKARAVRVGGVARHVAPSIRGTSDRVPAIRMGSSATLPTSGSGYDRTRGSRQTVSDVMWGAEFGSGRFAQFSPWRGSDSSAGYFLYPAIRDDSEEIQDRYSEALNDALRKV